MNTYATVVLAAGKGTRMRSALPKVLHQLAGVPLLAHVLKAIEALPLSFSSLDMRPFSHRPVVVLGYGAAQIEAVFAERCLYALQHEQLGTGHALLAAQSVVEALDLVPQTVLVCYGDMPLITSETLARVLVEHLMQHATITFLTAYTQQPSDFGRIVRDASGHVQAIVEAPSASEKQKRINEINSGVYCFDREWLWPTLQALPRNSAGEYYLTDLVAIASDQGHVITTVQGAVDETIGVNDPVQLAAAEQVLRRRVLEQHMYGDVTVVDLATTYIDDHVRIGRDASAEGGT